MTEPTGRKHDVPRRSNDPSVTIYASRGAASRSTVPRMDALLLRGDLGYRSGVGSAGLDQANRILHATPSEGLSSLLSLRSARRGRPCLLAGMPVLFTLACLDRSGVTDPRPPSSMAILEENLRVGSEGWDAGLHLPFNFHLILTAWNPRDIAALIDTYEAALPAGAWPNWVLGNHDRQRVASRVGAPQARVAAMLLLTLRGTPTLYQGDEIGMQDVPIPPEAVQDPVEWRLPGLGRGRDPERTPMQWDDSPNAGFSQVRPWLPLAADYQSVNVAAQKSDTRSMLSLYRRLIELRRASPALSVGSYRQLYVDDTTLVFERDAGDQRRVVALNLSADERALPDAVASLPVILSTHLDRAAEPATVLRPHEGVLLDSR